jgi:uncharacterized protein YqeY
MSIQHNIKESIKDAMRAKDEVRLMVLRGLSTAFVNELVASKRTPQEELEDQQALAVIKREAKKRKDSIEQFVNGGRPELAEGEKAELAILEAFLPAMMPEDEIRKVCEAKKAELGVTDKSGSGKLVGAIMKELNGQADGTVVKNIVDSLF